jgi:hypothetical protein
MGGLIMAYSMKQLQTITGKPPQTINRLMRRNESLIELLPEHRQKLNNGQVFYDDVILDWLKSYFQLDTENSQTVANEVGGEDTENETPDNPKTSPRPSTNDALIDELRRQVDELEEQLERKDKVIADLEKQLADKEAERLHFITQNGQLTALLMTVQQEKQKLLPPPKQPLGERIKGFFSRKKIEGGSGENE